MRIYLIKYFWLIIGFPVLAYASQNQDVVSHVLMSESEIQYIKQNDKGVHQILLSTPKRINNEIIIEKDIHQSGTLFQVMSRLPQTQKLVDGFNYYQKLLLEQGKITYKCVQRACGVSSYWANDIYDDRDLSGRDSNQYYLSGEMMYDGSVYIVSVYLVVNTLRQNLAFINIIKKNALNTQWKNGFLFSIDKPLTIASTLKTKLSNDSEAHLYVAGYTHADKFTSVSLMNETLNLKFLESQSYLSKELDISVDRIKHYPVGSFSEQSPAEGSDSWQRLFIFKP